MFLDNIVNKAWNHLTSFRDRLLSNGRRSAYIGAATLIIAAGARLARAETRYVDDDAKGLNNGTSWVNEYGHLEDELTVASIGNEQISFVARPDIGYVVKSEEKTDSISTLSRTLRLYGAEDIRPIGGLDRKGVSIVFSDYGASENQEIIEMLRANSRIKYAAPLFSVNGETIAIIPEIVARVTDETNSEQLQALCETIGLNIKKRMEYTKSEYLIEVLGNNANAVFDGVEQLNQLSYIEWAAPNIAFQLRFCGEVEPNDPYFSQQWHLQRINAPQAWEITKGDPNIVVAVLDTGVDYNHEDLIANIWRNHGEIPGNGIDDDENLFVDDVYGWDFKNNNPNLIDSEGHGTSCAGLIAAQGNNGIGVAGVTWNCKIMPIKIAQTGEDFATNADIATAIRYAAKNGADVLSNSWGGSGGLDTIIYHALSDVIELDGIGRGGKGCVVLFASGNFYGVVEYPANYREVITVGATDINDIVWRYSLNGAQLDIVAPSGDIDMKGNLWTTDITGSAGYNNRDPNILDYTDKMGGTSGACPVAAGVAALILSENPNLTNLEVERILVQSAHDLGPAGWDPNYGFGRVDAYKAVKMALNPPPTLTLFVDDNATNDLGPGDPNISDLLEDGSPEHSFDAIQKAIDKTFIIGDTIIVLPGIYTGEGNRDINFHGKTITVRSKYGPETCIIDCQNSGRGFVFNSGEGINSIVEGFTIINGKALRGGGMLNSSNSSPKVTNCIFSENSATSEGGGIYNSHSNPKIINCIFIENSAGYIGGGGIYNENSNPRVTNCIFIDNSVAGGSRGGGIHNKNSNPRVTNCTFSGNSGDNGGGMYNFYSNPKVTNCIFNGNSCGNSSNSYGGGMRNFYSNPKVTNCIFSENSATREGGGMSNEYNSNPKVTNCIFWSNIPNQISNIMGGAVLSYTNIQGGFPGEGNINVDPCFADPNNGDYHLKSQAGRWDPKSQSWVIDDVTSPCIDAGNPGSPLENELLNLPDDPNNIRGINLRINMGAYGGTIEASIAPHGYALLGDLNNDGIINIKDVALLVKYWLVAEKEQPCDLNRDGIVNEKDLALLAKDWLKQTVWYINNKIN